MILCHPNHQDKKGKQQKAFITTSPHQQQQQQQQQHQQQQQQLLNKITMNIISNCFYAALMWCFSLINSLTIGNGKQIIFET